MTGSTRAVAATILLSVLVLGTSSAGRSSPPQQTVRCDRGHDLQAAIDGAGTGAHLKLRGTCVGDFVITRDLRLKGLHGATLKGDEEGTILVIAAGADVTITDVIITGGVPDILNLPPERATGGIYNEGSLRLDGSTTVSNNTEYSCGPNPPDRSPCHPDFPWKYAMDRTAVINAGKLMLRDRASIRENYRGLKNYGTAVLEDRSSIEENSAYSYSVGVMNEGELILRDRATIRGNESRSTIVGVAGGVSNIGTMSMYDRSSVVANVAGQSGGGIANGGTLSLHDRATISRNVSDYVGGGVSNSGVIVLNGRYAIESNSAEDGGGGIFNRGTIVGSLDGVTNNTPDQCMTWDAERNLQPC